MPWPVRPEASRTSGCLGLGRALDQSPGSLGPSIARSEAADRSAPGRSALPTTTMSATSSRPALMAWTSSPIPGAWMTTVVSASAAISTSLWPVPTVSMMTISKPQAARTAALAAVVAGQAAGVTAGRHRADEDAAVRGMLLHAHAVTEDRAAGDGARGVDGEDRDGPPRGTAPRRRGPPPGSTCPTPGGPVMPTRWACAAAA